MSYGFLIAKNQDTFSRKIIDHLEGNLVTVLEKNNQIFKILQALKCLCVTFFGLYVCLQITHVVELIFANAKLEF